MCLLKEKNNALNIATCIKNIKKSSTIKSTGCPNSARIKILREVPTIPGQAPNIKYRVPISL